MIRNHSIFLLVVAFLISGYSMPAAGKCLLPERHGVSPTSTIPHQFAFSGSSPVHEWDGALNNGSRTDHIGGGVGGKLYTQDATGSTHYPFHNARSDIMAEFTTGGTMTWHGTYASNGIRQSEIGTRSSNYGANGKWEEPGSLINDGFRYRDRNTNTFITSDPAGFIDGPNTYNYVGHNPWSAWDPNGLATSLIVPTGTADIGYRRPDLGLSSTTTNPNAGVPNLTGSGMSSENVVPELSALLSDLGWLSSVVGAMEYPPEPPAPSSHTLDIESLHKTPAELTRMAHSGKYSPDDSAWLQEFSQTKSNAELDYELASSTTQGGLAILQPESVIIKGFTAALISMRGLSYLDDAVRLGSKADDFVVPLVSGSDEVVKVAKTTTQLDFGFVKNLENPNFVLYKASEFNPSMLRQGEHTLNLPYLRNEALDWAQSQQALQRAMNIGNPIREANPNALGGWLQRERDFLGRGGWQRTQQGSDVFWTKPPGQ